MSQEQIDILIHKCISGEATLADRRRLIELAGNFSHKAMFESSLDRVWEEVKVQPVFREAEQEKLLEYILAKDPDMANEENVGEVSIANSKVIRPGHFKRTWFRYAAAIIILVTGAAIWYVQHNHSKSFNPLNPSSRQIASNHARAILTLANGQQIILDSVQGNIVKQGSLTVLNLAGKLNYEGVGTASEYNTISTPKGGQYQIVLPDGSKVWLNAASSIKFPTAFTGNARKVEVTGEAYMEIAKNPKQSFVVTANGTEIQVLGTSFNVNAYEDESAVKTTLIEGSVKVRSGTKSLVSNRSNPTGSSLIVSSDQQSKAVILKPGQQCSVTGDQLLVLNNANLDQALAWKNGIFQFKDEDLKSVMRQLGRWYDMDVIYQGDVKLQERFNGKLQRSLNLKEVLFILEQNEVHFKVEGKKLIVMP